MVDLLYLHSSICDIKQSEVRFYTCILKEKLYPLICDIDAEVEKEMESAEEELGKHFNPDYDDHANFCERMHDLSINYGISLCETNGYIALLGIAGLYHLWEKQVKEFLIREISHCWKINDSDLRNFDEIKKLFKKYSTILEDFDFFDGLNELRLVANVVKHGGGSSLRELKKMNADILNDVKVHDAIFSGRYTMAGVDLFPSVKHIDHYGNAVMRFWDSSLWKQHGEHRYRSS